jgi:hypothetical protein
MLLQIVFWFFVSFAAADGEDDKKSRSTIDITAIIKMMLVIEGEEHHPTEFREKLKALGRKETWVEVKEHLNLLNLGVNSFRAYKSNAFSHPEAANDFKNIAILFPLSHGIESVAGEVATFVAAHMGASAATMAGIWSVGMIIKIPMLVDPLCILFFTSYKYSPHFRNSITYTRKKSLQFFHFVTDIFGIRSVFDHFFYWKHPLSQLHDMQNKGWRFDLNDFIEIEKPGIKLKIDNKGGNYFVKQIIADNFSPEVLQDLPFNIRYAIRRTIIKSKAEFYVDSHNENSWTFKDLTLPWGEKLASLNSCPMLFGR